MVGINLSRSAATENKWVDAPGVSRFMGRFAPCLVLMFLALGAQEARADAAISVDPATTYQTMTGWETTASASHGDSAYPAFRDAVMDAAVDQLGINRVRLEIRSGSENGEDNWALHQAGTLPYSSWRSLRYSTVNDNADPHSINWAGYHFSELDDAVNKVVLPLKTRLEARGESLWINLCYVAFTTQIGTGLAYHHDVAEEYAEFVEATYLHLDSTYGWVPDTWEVILEPDNVPQWSGTTIGRAIVATARRLEAHGFTPQFVAPSNTNMGRAITYFDNMVAVPGAIGYVREFSYHRYGGVSDANLAAIAARAATHGIDTAHLEWMGATYQELFKDLSIAGNSSWSQFGLAGAGSPPSDNGGLYFLVDTTDPTRPGVRMAPRTPFLAQYFRHVRRGAVRIGASSSNTNVKPLAFLNADGKWVVVIKTDFAENLTIAGLPGGNYGLTYSTAGESLVDRSDTTVVPGSPLSTSIPGAGVITVYARTAPPGGVDAGPMGRDAGGCPAATTACGGGCVDTTSDPSHCGGCDAPCAGGETCSGGSCVCIPDCSGRQCGADGCGGSCGSCDGTRLCSAGMCECLGSLSACGSACVDLRLDEAHCGSCGTGCAAGETCVAGSCEVGGVDAGCVSACDGRSCGDDTCGGSCGACGTGLACGGGGMCLCDAAETVCGDRCVDVRDDDTHCGVCDNPCPTGLRCVAGSCEGGMVDAGVAPSPSANAALKGGTGCTANGPSRRTPRPWALLLVLAAATTLHRRKPR